MTIGSDPSLESELYYLVIWSDVVQRDKAAGTSLFLPEIILKRMS